MHFMSTDCRNTSNHLNILYTEVRDLVCDRCIQILRIQKVRQFIISITWYWTEKVKFSPFQVCLSARILASCKSRKYRFIRRYLKFRGLCLDLCYLGTKISAMVSLWPQVIFKCSFIHQFVMNFKKMRKVRTFLVRMIFYRMVEPA